MNVHAIKSIYRFELARWFRTLLQSILAPVISTSLYFVVFGSAIGSRMQAIEGVSYGAFIIPGLVMLSLLSESISNASFGIYMPKWAGTIYELLSAPVSWIETVIGYVGAAATKSVLLGLLILATARLFVPFEIAHPFVMALFLVLTAVTFSLFGFVIGVWADNFQKLQIVPALIITPLTFLGGSFYSINMLPPIWQKITLFNPVVYLVSGFRWSFYGVRLRRRRRRQPGHDLRVPGPVPDRRLVDLQDGLSSEDVRSGEGAFASSTSAAVLALGRGKPLATIEASVARIIARSPLKVARACQASKKPGSMRVSMAGCTTTRCRSLAFSFRITSSRSTIAPASAWKLVMARVPPGSRAARARSRPGRTTPPARHRSLKTSWQPRSSSRSSWAGLKKTPRTGGRR
jgi:ABC-2 type transport system permease protein